MLSAAATVSVPSTNGNSLSSLMNAAPSNAANETRLLEEILNECWPDPMSSTLEIPQPNSIVPKKNPNTKARKRKSITNLQSNDPQSTLQIETNHQVQFEPVTPVTNGPSQSTSHLVLQRNLCENSALEAPNSIPNSSSISESNTQASQAKQPRIDSADGTLNGTDNLVFSFDSYKYIADLYDNFIASHITTSSAILTSMRRHYYKHVTLDLTIATINAGVNVTPEMVFLTFIDVVTRLALLPQ